MGFHHVETKAAPPVWLNTQHKTCLAWVRAGARIFKVPRACLCLRRDISVGILLTGHNHGNNLRLAVPQLIPTHRNDLSENPPPSDQSRQASAHSGRFQTALPRSSAPRSQRPRWGGKGRNHAESTLLEATLPQHLRGG